MERLALTEASEQETSPDAARLAALIEAVGAHKDKSAFAALFDYFAPRVKSYLLRLGADNGQAEELAQEVMIQLWRKAATFDRDKAAPATWVFRIARNKRIDAFRRAAAASDFDPYDPNLLPEPETPPDDALNAVQREDILRQAVEQLPEEQLDLLRLAFFEGLTHVEIAERRDLPLGTVKSRIRLALEKLRAKLSDDI